MIYLDYVATTPLAPEIKETYIKCGNIEQKGMRSDAVSVANLSNQPINVEFALLELNKG